MRPPIVFAANSAWNIVHFRSALVRAVAEAGYEPVIVSPPDASLADALEELGAGHIAVNIDRSGLNGAADYRLYRSYLQIFRAIRPAAMLGFTIKPNIYGSLAARRLDIPAIVNISGLGTVFLRGGLLSRFVVRLYRRALRRSAVIFFQNADDRALFLKLGIARESQARLLPGSGIDLQGFTPTPLPDGPFTFLLVARLLGDKGIREYVEAARALKQEWPQVRFQLLGPIDEGNRTAIPRAELQRWTAEETVSYLGAAEDVKPYIQQASAVVLPSYREGLPRTLLEGAAMARPLVATDVPGCRDVVQDSVTGFLCRSHDAVSLADAMRKLLALSPEGCARMGAAGRALVEERFSLERVVEAYLSALRSTDSATVLSR